MHSRQKYAFFELCNNFAQLMLLHRIVDSFNKTKSLFVLLVSTKACGLGLNLAGMFSKAYVHIST